jgi:hypothetical protein
LFESVKECIAENGIYGRTLRREEMQNIVDSRADQLEQNLLDLIHRESGQINTSNSQAETEIEYPAHFGVEVYTSFNNLFKFPKVNTNNNKFIFRRLLTGRTYTLSRLSPGSIRLLFVVTIFSVLRGVIEEPRNFVECPISGARCLGVGASDQEVGYRFGFEPTHATRGRRDQLETMEPGIDTSMARPKSGHDWR